MLENIYFDGNTFQETTGPAVEATSFKNLIFSKNNFINHDKAPVALSMRGCIRAEHGTGLWVEQNSWATSKNIEAPSVFYDPETVHNTNVVCRDNRVSN